MCLKFLYHISGLWVGDSNQALLAGRDDLSLSAEC